ncbi:hypothetical protein PPERSA_11952 [Pseudocohnilembus persalinus]|uniref:Uncharacterized protein n=1 Tax=Pseudocohnilembus persalinus TaxID=266149 RepID=A0A0V0QKA6_PSEPJ|nr:hypothetical protein PPERSA_11952 [Pseudocohnilembus persalinus]|eukprot:KRX02612.1 hypothetical protein PPERSA_11952 [Pseudocohnilembus persalinus]
MSEFIKCLYDPTGLGMFSQTGRKNKPSGTNLNQYIKIEKMANFQSFYSKQNYRKESKVEKKKNDQNIFQKLLQDQNNFQDFEHNKQENQQQDPQTFYKNLVNQNQQIQLNQFNQEILHDTQKKNSQLLTVNKQNDKNKIDKKDKINKFGQIPAHVIKKRSQTISDKYQKGYKELQPFEKQSERSLIQTITKNIPRQTIDFRNNYLNQFQLNENRFSQDLNLNPKNWSKNIKSHTIDFNSYTARKNLFQNKQGPDLLDPNLDFIKQRQPRALSFDKNLAPKNKRPKSGQSENTSKRALRVRPQSAYSNQRFITQYDSFNDKNQTIKQNYVQNKCLNINEKPKLVQQENSNNNSIQQLEIDPQFISFTQNQIKDSQSVSKVNIHNMINQINNREVTQQLLKQRIMKDNSQLLENFDLKTLLQKEKNYHNKNFSFDLNAESLSNFINTRNGITQQLQYNNQSIQKPQIYEGDNNSSRDQEKTQTIQIQYNQNIEDYPKQLKRLSQTERLLKR